MLVCTELTGKTTIRRKPQIAPRRILNELTNQIIWFNSPINLTYQIGANGYTTYMYIIRLYTSKRNTLTM